MERAFSKMGFLPPLTQVNGKQKQKKNGTNCTYYEDFNTI